MHCHVPKKEQRNMTYHNVIRAYKKYTQRTYFAAQNTNTTLSVPLFSRGTEPPAPETFNQHKSKTGTFKTVIHKITTALEPRQTSDKERRMPERTQTLFPEALKRDFPKEST
jgi:hypothetical protein